MTELLSLSLLYVAITTWFGSSTLKRQPRWPWFSTPVRRLSARLAGCFTAGLATYLWSTIEPGPAAGFVTIIGLMVMGTVVALVGSVAPRVILYSAWCVYVLIPVLVMGRGFS